MSCYWGITVYYNYVQQHYIFPVAHGYWLGKCTSLKIASVTEDKFERERKGGLRVSALQRSASTLRSWRFKSALQRSMPVFCFAPVLLQQTCSVSGVSAHQWSGAAVFTPTDLNHRAPVLQTPPKRSAQRAYSELRSSGPGLFCAPFQHSRPHWTSPGDIWLTFQGSPFTRTDWR